ncbi:hypothetical protein A3C09_03090 [Candidatus Uhrbacteria bacterium RIFCSPHIGHO2_02_FULL_47_44]|uniref:PIN domain-containing protein n=1 Tax=Candidatus Uhrbacteria bacterium RIFCSPLOWO2_02_FULL_48_18 TaxID=1802408 RepID=A0A1F7V7U8_9BACT|nr:MAG: hypothetical protein A2839_01715 [Candidatus Uhrbacteria bacterium RIFCSPHIGHO2_01_FULL_47_10]OGL70897.1 MAG: hypothetical protein A3C09_03090 [Candidatus Uhrbacteria bacterium RIFCSPHIGHO2_02_FULL_47_44]OGL77557.1 MAG: hypothetical protein A3E97_02715 [Candidatus Uhrbacteria bacterium RIFCSPHIGHO2_12_FULL_47_12]OGL80778.1 MAG: hypothetical protein A3B20_05330 [Candidatus Uhrbacteria bacterium RIFCSPLOWO2_01_FULL_47_17]OGL86570.1 MAG: hypothetical protein A3I41_04770 [Candidatus Uhrbact
MGQIVALDTSIFIYVFEEHSTFGKRAEKILKQIDQGKQKGILSVIGMIELQTGPKSIGRHDVAARYREILTTFPNLSIMNLNESIVERTSDLRAKYKIATPDAIHLATAIEGGASSFITNDKTLKKVKEIKVILL